MNVAIIGAGLAGLSCSHELEKYEIKHTIFETNSFIGEQFPHVGGALEITTRSKGDILKYMRDKLDIEIRPINTLNKIIQHSPKRTNVVNGKLGYFLNRGRDADDIKVQIFSKLKNPHILFNNEADYETLSKKYDYVVIANGQINFTKELGCWFEWVDTYVRGAVVLGDFDPNTLIIWLNKEYCKNGYAYLIPFSEKKASLVLVVNDVTEKEIDHYWELFFYSENIKYTIIEEFKLNHKSGHVYPHSISNILLAGNSGGAIDPFLGFGVLTSVGSGVMAARSIIKNKDYEKLLKPFLKTNYQMYEFKKALDKFNNRDYDRLIRTIGLPGISQLIYHSKLDVVKYGSYIIKKLSSNKEEK